MNEIDAMFAQELRDIVESIEWHMEPGDIAGNYWSQCAIDRIKRSEFWREEGELNDGCR